MKKLFLLGVVSIFLCANESTLLTETRQEIIELKKQKITEKEKVNQYDWISDLNLNASISNTQDTKKDEDYSLSLSQDIFNFGGISSQINYAKELKRLEDLNLEISTNEDINILYNYVLDIQLTDISLKQNSLNIENSQIDITQKKSEYKEGELSISDLNDAIITKNNLRETYQTLLLSKEKDINALKTYTNKKYDEINLPVLKPMIRDVYLEKSTAILYTKLNKEVNNLLYKIKKSDYLPTLSVDAKYGYANDDESDGDDYYKYGLSITVPLSYTSSNDISQSKIEYLSSQKELEQKVNDVKLFYDEVIMEIKSNHEKITLAKEDITLYNELLIVNEEEYKAGYKTVDDINILKNSRNIRKLDIKSYKLNIERLFLSLYFTHL